MYVIVLIRDAAVCVFKTEATVSITISEERQNWGGRVAGQTEVKLME